MTATPEAKSPQNPDSDAAKLAEIRAIFDAFDWECDDRQYALEQIEMIVGEDAVQE